MEQQSSRAVGETLMDLLLDEPQLAHRILDHIDQGTTDLGGESWREPVENYRSEDRLHRELRGAFWRTQTGFCPSAALAKPGAYLAREAAGTPIVAVRGADGQVRAFRNACRHRGTAVACGAGTAAALVCPYHGWAYGLDGTLRGVPHEHGFPGLDKATHGLVRLPTIEHGGVIFVMQDPSAAAAPPLSELPTLLPPDLLLISTNEQETRANWKIAAESFLEGYHIRSTHRETFFPVQYDNLNVVEFFGANSRITFPYRNIEKLRGVPPSARRVAGTLTHVYHLFPNVMIATFPKRTIMVVLEPIGVGSTNFVTYTLADAATAETDQPGLTHDTDFVTKGAKEDRAVVESIQRGLASGANEHFEFGQFESAIVHFHRNLNKLLGEGA
jgi:phenylpropionate dioxygenase-like ring-hydroxylating dioxygenase large terminal subunit